MITGVRADAETAVRAGIRHILFTGQPEATAAAIDTYLKSLQPVPSPRLQKGKLSKEARRGEKIFQKAGCAACHVPPLYTDRKQYDVGVGIGPDKNRAFDTPTLREVWRTSPYLYDGRAVMMYEVIYNFNKNNKHGSTTKLEVRDWYDLIEFVFSI
jgi:cytochrome c peroxidase